MRHIQKILQVKPAKSAAGKSYFITLAQLDDGVEAEGYGNDFLVGQRVQVYYHEKYNRVKFRKY